MKLCSSDNYYTTAPHGRHLIQRGQERSGKAKNYSSKFQQTFAKIRPLNVAIFFPDKLSFLKYIKRSCKGCSVFQEQKGCNPGYQQSRPLDLSGGVLRNFAKFTGKHLCQRLLFNKVAGLSFTVNFAKFLRTPPDDCFWKYVNLYYYEVHLPTPERYCCEAKIDQLVGDTHNGGSLSEKEQRRIYFSPKPESYESVEIFTILLPVFQLVLTFYILQGNLE